ncbi:MAG: SRPBCC domain-containing protein [Gemmatimonadota bacterium]
MTNFVAKVSQLINCEPADAFNAFVDPDRITRFWLGASSGPLAKDARVTWTFMVPGAVDTIAITEFEPTSLIAFHWSDGSNTRIEFSAHSTGKTQVSVEIHGSAGDDLVEQIVNTTEGFSIVLCDLKTLIESGQSAGLVRAKAELIAASVPGGAAETALLLPSRPAVGEQG